MTTLQREHFPAGSVFSGALTIATSSSSLAVVPGLPRLLPRVVRENHVIPLSRGPVAVLHASLALLAGLFGETEVLAFRVATDLEAVSELRILQNPNQHAR